MKAIFLIFFSLILTACGSNPASYLSAKSQPLVNIEAKLAKQIRVQAQTDKLALINHSEVSQQLNYKLFWYDKNGVSQIGSPEVDRWQSLNLPPKQNVSLPLIKPTEESTNYRIYLRQ